MDCVEVGKSCRLLSVPPHLTQDINIDCTHELLSEDIETVRDMEPQDIIGILECAMSKRMIVLKIVIQRFSKKIQAVQMMKSFHIRRISAPIVIGDLNLIGRESCHRCEVCWNNGSSIVYT